jgi:hypothetical protein
MQRKRRERETESRRWKGSGNDLISCLASCSCPKRLAAETSSAKFSLSKRRFREHRHARQTDKQIQVERRKVSTNQDPSILCIANAAVSASLVFPRN